MTKCYAKNRTFDIQASIVIRLQLSLDLLF